MSTLLVIRKCKITNLFLLRNLCFINILTMIKVIGLRIVINKKVLKNEDIDTFTHRYKQSYHKHVHTRTHVHIHFGLCTIFNWNFSSISPSYGLTRCNRNFFVLVFLQDAAGGGVGGGGVKGVGATWPDAVKQSGAGGTLTPADRHGSVQVSRSVFSGTFHSLSFRLFFRISFICLSFFFF